MRLESTSWNEEMARRWIRQTRIVCPRSKRARRGLQGSLRPKSLSDGTVKDTIGTHLASYLPLNVGICSTVLAPDLHGLYEGPDFDPAPSDRATQTPRIVQVDRGEHTIKDRRHLQVDLKRQRRQDVADRGDAQLVSEGRNCVLLGDDAGVQLRDTERGEVGAAPRDLNDSGQCGACDVAVRGQSGSVLNVEGRELGPGCAEPGEVVVVDRGFNVEEVEV